MCASNISADQDQTDLSVQRRICLDYNDTVKKLFHKTPEPITAELTSMTFLKKQADLYLQPTFAGDSVPFCASKLTVVD